MATNEREGEATSRPVEEDGISVNSVLKTSEDHTSEESRHESPNLIKTAARRSSGITTSENSASDGVKKDHRFWSTQPVPQYQEPSMMQTTEEAQLPEGAILSEKVCRALVKQPEPLLAGFEWCEVDLKSSTEIKELYELLDLHYVEDNDGSFRFNYSAQFLKWALMPPGWRKEWHIGVRTQKSTDGKQGKLVAFISAVPAALKIQSTELNAVEINFLTVHRKLRNKRLAPVLIKEITRRCYKVGIYQALYTAGTVLPTPISTCRYFHRSLDWNHLYAMSFCHVPPHSSKQRQELKYRLDSALRIPGIRKMRSSDVQQVSALLAKYTARFKLRQTFSNEEIAHLFCSEESKDIVSTYVVESDGVITDMISYYLLESSVLRAAKPEKIRAAYLYYYATDTAVEKAETIEAVNVVDKIFQERLSSLVHDALVFAKQAKFHVFNALTLQDNPMFLAEQKFEAGDGKLHYYLFNWRTNQLPGGIDENGGLDKGKTRGVGIVML